MTGSRMVKVGRLKGSTQGGRFRGRTSKGATQGWRLKGGDSKGVSRGEGGGPGEDSRRAPQGSASRGYLNITGGHLKITGRNPMDWVVEVGRAEGGGGDPN